MSVLDRLLHRPRALLGVALLLSLLISPLLRRLNLHGDLLDLLPRSSQARKRLPHTASTWSPAKSWSCW
jgi:predicted exporter